MQFKFLYLPTEVIQIDTKLKEVAIKMFKIHNRLGFLNQKNREIAPKNLPKWHLASEKNDTIKTIINYQKTFNTS